ncbi:MAG TPA: N,N-dimethylformamidase beta subunit family domain-containing protein [Vicinamibacterales bacterium]|nr:N,N-dimethylformamidase beta subunit family domain-containing protein [Vicinamibacterales bacterium]
MHPLARVLFIVTGAVALGGTLGPPGFNASSPVAQPDRCQSPANRIVAENCRPGHPAIEWDVNGAGDPRIQGFATDVSVNLGDTVAFKVRTDSPSYRVDIYRLGYYGGMGARRLDSIRPTVALPQRQPECLTDEFTRLYDCGNWQVSVSWRVPPDAVSGIYIARLVREDPEPGSWRVDNTQTTLPKPEPGPHAYGALGHGRLANALVEPRASHIYFVVRDDASRSDLLFQTSDTTWQAYNRWGWGSSTYGSFDPARPARRAYKVSYNRPYETRAYRAVNKLFNAEYPMVRWLEANGFDVTYSTGVDSDRRGHLIGNHMVFLSVGHDEYWSGRQRAHVEAARDAGVHLAFFSGNDVFWKIRWESSTDPSATPYRTLVTYKETHDNRKIDPLPDVWTGTFRDGRPFNPEGARPENALTGTIFTVNAWRNDPLIVPAEFARLRFWRNTEVAALGSGQAAVLGHGILGHEWNEDLDNGFRPAGLVRMSRTTVDNVSYIQDHGTVYDSGTATHHLTMYRAPSGALVFSAGTVQWAWGLDPYHDTETGIPPERANPTGAIRVGVDLKGPVRAIQQATINLFADMGAQPASLQPGLVPSSRSTDARPPSSRIVSPQDGEPIADRIRVSGTATDAGGGVVAGIEVSLDGGARWHPAEGTGSWSYEGRVSPGSARVHVLSRAVDDSGNIETPGPGVRLEGRSQLQTPNFQLPKSR